MIPLRPVIRLLQTKLYLFRIVFAFIHGFLIFSTSSIANDKVTAKAEKGSVEKDTVFIKKGNYILFKNSTITIPRDTFYLINVPRQIKVDPYKHSEVFYDTVYKKFSRRKLTKLLYYLAFVPPKQSNLPDTLQVLKSTKPFEEFEGKVIRNISIKVLPPFGRSVYDTGRIAITGVGKALNSVHMNTRKYVIRRNLLFKKGDLFNPELMADNERILKDISAIDDARILVAASSPGSDSVDLVVVSKDVWSIGIDVPLITPEKVRFRVYDANFLGLGDKLTTIMSLDLYRAPFFIFEGLSYTYSNIGGSLINASFGYEADHLGNSRVICSFDRSFLTNMTRWAGGISGLYQSNVNLLTDGTTIVSYSNSEGIWLGWAIPFKNKKEISRAVITGAVYRNMFTSRPYVDIDSNRGYYNHRKIMTSFSISKNNYYLTDYVLDFGRTENLPYGHLYQVTAGIDRCDFYTRFYSGINLSFGNFFARFGYISAYLKFGGYLNNSSFEDAVFKLNLHYFTPLLNSSDKRYKFRAFYTVDYRSAINSRSNNSDYFDANQDFDIENVKVKEYFRGVNIISNKLSAVCFTPWYFYGFRIGLLTEFQLGLVAEKQEPILKNPLFSSIGVSIIVKNDNLVFPAFVISGYYYPSSAGYYNPVQFTMSSGMNIDTYDFNVSAPHEENLGN